MSEAKYYSPREILDLQSRQGALNDTEKFVVDASFWARARLANYHGYSDEIPAIELNNGVFYAYTSRGKIKIPYNYDALHDKYNIEERKVLKVDTHEPDMDITQNIPQGDLEQMNGEEDITGIEQMPDGSENMPQNQFDTNFDAGVEADEETDPKRYIQQLAGKLSQSLRSYNSELPSPDIDLNKYVVGMINKQALKGMNDKDVNDVLAKIKGDEEADDIPSEETSVDEMPDENMEQTDDMAQNESINRDIINEIFQELIAGNKDVNNKIADKPISNIGYKKKPYTSPNFK